MSNDDYNLMHLRYRNALQVPNATNYDIQHLLQFSTKQHGEPDAKQYTLARERHRIQPKSTQNKGNKAKG